MREPYGFLDAVLRYDRAGEHLANIQTEITKFRGEPHDIGTHLGGGYSGHTWFEYRNVSVPLWLSLLVGEMTYNLRASLDYATVALAWHDTGAEPDGEWLRHLQFPIEDCEKVFERRRPTLLKGLCDDHVAMVKEYQPCEGCDWTAVLRSLNDADKHRHLTLLAGSISIEGDNVFTIATPHPEAVPNESGRYAIDEMDVQDRAFLDIVFMEDRRLVSETLEELQAQVGLLLRRFWAEFTLRPVD